MWHVYEIYLNFFSEIRTYTFCQNLSPNLLQLSIWFSSRLKINYYLLFISWRRHSIRLIFGCLVYRKHSVLGVVLVALKRCQTSLHWRLWWFIILFLTLAIYLFNRLFVCLFLLSICHRCGCRFIYNPITNLINPALRSSGHRHHLITRNDILFRTNGYLNPTNPFGTTNGYLNPTNPLGTTNGYRNPTNPLGRMFTPSYNRGFGFRS